MFKTMGILGIVISCGLIGMNQKHKLIRRIQLLEDYYKMILNMKGHINYFKEPLTDIIKKLTKNSDSKAYLLLKAIEYDISNKSHEIHNIWAKNVKITYHKCPITQKDQEIMAYLGNFIGQTDYLNQLQHFEYLETNLKGQIEQAKDELHSKGPMFNKVGYFIGAIIGIILI